MGVDPAPKVAVEDGFAFHETVTRLYERLTREDPDTASWDLSKPLSQLGWFALDHPAKHEQGGCARRPCPALGVSYALHVCGEVARERDAFEEIMRYVTAVERLVGKQLNECMEELPEATDAFVKWSDALHESEQRAGDGYTRRRYVLMSEEPRRLLEQGRIWIEQLREQTAKLREMSTDPAVWQQPGPGRRPHLLLKAIRQHLAVDGGLNYGEIARLTPDGGDPAYVKQKDRVRKDVEDDDVRWLFSSSRPGKIVPGG